MEKRQNIEALMLDGVGGVGICLSSVLVSVVATVLLTTVYRILLVLARKRCRQLACRGSKRVCCCGKGVFVGRKCSKKK